TAGGNISTKNIGGNASIATGGGNIEAGIVSGKVELKSGGGNIELKSAKGKVEVKTGAGNIELHDVSGSVNAFTGAGEINIKLMPDDKSKNEIKTSSGNIFLYISENSKTTIEAKSTYYGSGSWSSDEQTDIISDFNPSETKSSSSKNYKTFILNGGGSSINLQTAYGSIEIRKIKK
ncbi:MAG: DUF4097 family beta strand repeat-containing protein, partial [Ignavibacteriaceae bacterium]